MAVFDGGLMRYHFRLRDFATSAARADSSSTVADAILCADDRFSFACWRLAISACTCFSNASGISVSHCASAAIQGS